MSGLLTGYLHRTRNAVVRGYVRGDVLDIGCGPATIAEFLEPSQKYVGIEIQEGYIRYLCRRFPQHTFVRRDVEREALSLGNLRFDTVLMLALLEHLSRPQKVMREVQLYMNPEAHLVVTTPSLVGGAIHRVGAAAGLFSKHALAEHKRMYDRGDLHNLLTEAGMHPVLYRTFGLRSNQLCISIVRK